MVLVKYSKQHHANDEAFEQVILKAQLFIGWYFPFAKRRNRQGSLGWWTRDEGLAELDRGRHHLIALLDTAQLIFQDGVIMKGDMQ